MSYRSWIVAIASLLGIVGSSAAYMGGPVRVVLRGYETKESHDYFELQAFDETGNQPEIYRLELASARPGTPVRLEHLESRYENGRVVRVPEWSEIRGRLEPLVALSDHDLRMSVRSESTGVDSRWGVATIDLGLSLEIGAASVDLVLPAACSPRAGVRGVYAVPGRPAYLAVILFVGRPYGCEEVERVVLLEPVESPD